MDEVDRSLRSHLHCDARGTAYSEPYKLIGACATAPSDAVAEAARGPQVYILP